MGVERLIKGQPPKKGLHMITGRLARILGSAALVTGIATAGSAVVMSGAAAAGASTGAGGGDEPAYNCTGANGGVIPPGTYEIDDH